MTFRHSLYLSFAGHLIIFGSAIAFAHYAVGAFTFLPPLIQVSLVSPTSDPGQETGAAQALKREQHQASPQTPEMPVKQRDQVSEEMAMPADMSTALLIPAEGTGNEGAGNLDSSGNSQNGGPIISSAGTGNNNNPGFGLISPEQWSAIESAIERTKNYPRLARERGIEGVVRLRFKVNSDGTIGKIEILESSGSEILDTASIRAVYRAAPMPAVSGWIEIPIKYVLK